MSPRRLRRLSAWLLPFLAARLLVPAGFMLSLADGGLDIVLCSGLGPAAAATAAAPSNLGHAAHSAHAGMAHAAHGMDVDAAADLPVPQQSEHTQHADTICPFAFAGTAAMGAADQSVVEAPRLASLLPRLSSDPAWIAPAVLIDRIRGPPLA